MSLPTMRTADIARVEKHQRRGAERAGADRGNRDQRTEHDAGHHGQRAQMALAPFA
jgi:hypothetical protein